VAAAGRCRQLIDAIRAAIRSSQPRGHDSYTNNRKPKHISLLLNPAGRSTEELNLLVGLPTLRGVIFIQPVDNIGNGLG